MIKQKQSRSAHHGHQGFRHWPAGGLIACALWLTLGVTEASPTSPPANNDPTAFSYKTLPIDGSVDFVITRNSPSFEFHSGQSPYQAFRLPDAPGRYLIDVVSFLEHPDAPEQARVFYPIVALLTDDFLVSRTTDFSALRFDLPVFEHTTQPAYRLTVGIDPIALHERYLVVFTARAILEKRSLPIISDPANATEGAHDVLLGASPTGRLQIMVRPAELPISSGTDPSR